MKAILDRCSGGLGRPLLAARAPSAQKFGPPELIEAAKKEGKLVYYTANFAEVEQEVIKAFNKRFPAIKVEMVRAPGGQLITRVKTEAAAGKLAADVVDHSDRGADERARSTCSRTTRRPMPPTTARRRMISPKLWPRVTLVWSIAYNSALVKNPPKTWMDLTKPEYGNKQIGQVIAPSGGTTWTRVMFERQVLGEDYWKKQAATNPVLYPSGAPTVRRAGARRDLDRAAALQHRLPEEARRRAGGNLLPARRRAGEPVCQRRAEDRQPTRTPPSCSSTGACRRKARPS